jgi:cytochrome c-type biogenesis protein CcmH
MEARGVTLPIILLITGGLAFTLWRFCGLSSGARTIALAGLALGVAGYALQGQPSLAGHPVDTPTVPIPAELKNDAHSVPPNSLDHMLRAETFLRAGQTERGMAIIKTLLAKNPDDPNLWVGLATVLVAQSKGILSPAADHSFRKASTIDPNNMALQYFYGTALATNGRNAEAREQWLPLLRRLPKGNPQREQLIGLITQSGVLTPAEINAAVSAK